MPSLSIPSVYLLQAPPVRAGFPATLLSMMARARRGARHRSSGALLNAGLPLLAPLWIMGLGPGCTGLVGGSAWDCLGSHA